MEQVDIACRCFTEPVKSVKLPFQKEEAEAWIPDRSMAFDTETTLDQYQNLTFGDSQIYDHGQLETEVIFHGDLGSDDQNTLTEYVEKVNIQGEEVLLMPVQEFVDGVFLPEVYDLGTECIGHNLPFDTPRLSVDWGTGRKHNRDGFSFQLSENTKYPNLGIKHGSGKFSFIRFNNGQAPNTGQNHKRRGKSRTFRGRFLDTHTMAYALTDESLSLEQACIRFQTPIRKVQAKEHGKITPEYIEYNRNDVRATYELAKAMKAEYATYHLDLPATELYSPASLGKAYLKGMGIESFRERNPRFSRDVLGYGMECFYGGRSEVRIRKTPVRTTVIDFLSMYPTMCILQDIWSYVIASRIDAYDDSNAVREFVDHISLETFRDKSAWKCLNAICLIQPHEDILPVRCNYNHRNTYNIGLNYLSGEPTWYALADVLVSKLLTGQTPDIIGSIRVVPKGKQRRLRSIVMVGDRVIDPYKEDFFLAMMEYRSLIKAKLKGIDKHTHPEEYARIYNVQKIIKIIANATAYGVFVELNPERCDAVKTNVYGSKNFTIKTEVVEKPGRFFNPFLGLFITAASRLVLGITEALLNRHGAVYSYCDTDGIGIPPEHVAEVQDYFQTISPYSFQDRLFKVEKEGLFYGISAKRYAVYELEDGRPKIIEHKSHGLGHLVNPYSCDGEDGERPSLARQVWEDILMEHYRLRAEEEILEKYRDIYAISKLAITTPNLLSRFRAMNKDRKREERIKPFNFMLVGVANFTDRKTSEQVRPIAPYSKDIRLAPHSDFIDYNHDGKILRGAQYWRTLDDFYWNYKNHPEAKFDGDVGILERKHLTIGSKVYIGKESNRLEEASVLGVEEEDTTRYVNMETKSKHDAELRAFIMGLSTKEALIHGINRKELYRLKVKAAIGDELQLYAKTRRRLAKAMKMSKSHCGVPIMLEEEISGEDESHTSGIER